MSSQLHAVVDFICGWPPPHPPPFLLAGRKAAWTAESIAMSVIEPRPSVSVASDVSDWDDAAHIAAFAGIKMGAVSSANIAGSSRSVHSHIVIQENCSFLFPSVPLCLILSFYLSFSLAFSHSARPFSSFLSCPANVTASFAGPGRQNIFFCFWYYRGFLSSLTSCVLPRGVWRPTAC
jgi:hypothetical protein